MMAYYAAPELWLQGEEYDNKVDVWSLGVTVSELLTGEVRLARPNWIIGL